MDYTIRLYQIDTENIIYKEFINYMTNDLKKFKPIIYIRRFDAEFNIHIYDKYKLTNCYKIINRFVKYKTHCEHAFDDDICIYMEIR